MLALPPQHVAACTSHDTLPGRLCPRQALSNTLWGLSKLGIQAPELMEGIGQEARSQLFEYNSQNLANSVGGRRGGRGSGVWDREWQVCTFRN